MIKEAFDAGFQYGVTLALQLIKQAQDYYGATDDRDLASYWSRMYGMTPEEYYAAISAQQPTPEAAPPPARARRGAEAYGMTPEEYYAAYYGTAPEYMYGATSDYYPYY